MFVRVSANLFSKLHAKLYQKRLSFIYDITKIVWFFPETVYNKYVSAEEPHNIQ